MEEQKKPVAELRSISGGRRSFSIGGTLGNMVAIGLGALGLLALACAVLGGVWLVEQLWGAVS